MHFGILYLPVVWFEHVFELHRIVIGFVPFRLIELQLESTIIDRNGRLFDLFRKKRFKGMKMI